MEISRRKFLIELGSATCISAGLYIGLGQDLFAAGTKLKRSGKWLLVGSSSEKAVYRIDLHTGAATAIPVELVPHGFLLHPTNPNRAWTAEKWGRHAAEVDFSSGKVIRRILLPEGIHFAGHSFFTPGGKSIYFSQLELATGYGRLAGYDCANLKALKPLELATGVVHDCGYAEGGMAWLGSGGRRWVNGEPGTGTLVEPSCMLRLNLSSGKVLEKKFIDERFTIVHFVRFNKGSTLLQAVPRQDESKKDGIPPGIVYLSAGPDEPYRAVQLPDSLTKKLKGEFLSAAVRSDGKVALLTNPDSGLLVRIDVKKAEYLSHMESPARGIVFDSHGKRFVASGDAPGLFAVGEGKDVQSPIPVSGVASRTGAPVNLDSSHSLLV